MLKCLPYLKTWAYFFVQLFGYLVPILEIPVLARSLGVQEYGKVVLIQSVALLSSLVVGTVFVKRRQTSVLS